MSDLWLYGLEDTVWDELYQNDDHIVPHPGNGQAHPVLSDSLKKPRCEKTSISNNILDTYGVCPPSGSISIKEASSVASENTTSSSHVLETNDGNSNSNDYCAKDTDKTTAVANNSFSCPLGDIAHAGNNLDLFEDTEVKDSSDFSYYGWPDIGNFDDVDRMFRNCDSTFGLGTCNKDELGWFPSADNIGGLVDIMKSDCKFACPESNPLENSSQNQESSNGCSMNVPAMISEPMRYKDGSWISETSDCYMSLVNEAMGNSNGGFIPIEQIEEQKKQVELRKEPVGETEEHQMLNCCISCTSDLPNEVVQQHHPGSCNYLQNHLSYLSSDNISLCDLTSVNDAVKSETNDFTFNECNPGPIGKQVYYSEDKFENDTDIEGVSVVVPAELASSNVQESSTVGSGMHDISLDEAASFLQLQRVMEQLDWRTKICIRDGLYRLAHSAERRHNHANPCGSCGDQRDATGAFIAERTNNFVHMETVTNPVDRSIAHLLFHRPSDSSAVPAYD